MSTIKLFKTLHNKVTELKPEAFGVEKSLQRMIENNLELFLGVRFLATEYTTGKKHAGRIDTLGIDENGAPVIIEYKRSINENVINQGLFYLDWLLDHKGEFTLMVLKKYGKETSENIEWANSRLLCIAGDYTKYDEYAVEQINRNIELIRYRKFEDGIILFELVNAISAVDEQKERAGTPQKYATVLDLQSKLSAAEKDRYENLKAFILALGDDVQEKITKYYIAYKRISNFACFEFHPNDKEILIFLKIDPTTVTHVEGFSRDVSNIGHFGTGDLELRIRSDEDIKRAQELIALSYENN